MSMTQPLSDASARILIIDDDSVTRHMVRGVLSKQGYTVDEADSGIAGVQLFERAPYDLVLLDMVMPNMSGEEACTILREEAGEALPIIMLTGRDDRESIESAFNAGATDFLTKPVNWTLMGQRISYALRGSAIYHKLQRRQEQLAEAQRIAKMGYWTLDVEENMVRMSEGCQAILRLSRKKGCYALEELLERVHPDDLGRVMEQLGYAVDTGEPYKLEHRVVGDGPGEEAVVIQQGEVRPEPGYPRGRIMGTIQDVTELYQARKELEYQTYYDPLTDLPNRRSLEVQVAHLLEEGFEETLAAVVFVGLDHFAPINDSLGHRGGDQVLRIIAERLRALEAEGHFISRFSGDIFALVLKGLNHVDEGDELLGRILLMVAQGLDLDGHEIYLSASLGATVFPLESEESGELIKGAEAAMLHAKAEGGNRFVYRTAEMNDKAQARFAMEKAMRRGVEAGEFQVYYQPQVTAEDGRIIGMEALVRWLDPEKGLVRPDFFIPLAEETGLIVPIGRQVLFEACRRTRAWLDEGYELCVGVNVSALQFAQPDLVEMIAEALAESGLPPYLLEVEVTESMAMADYQSTIDKLSCIRAMGVKTSMDDFGTGYSSLSTLQQLPLDTLKVDQAFVRCITGSGEAKDCSDCQNGAIASAVIAMSHSLGLHVIAEGVETEGQYRFLKMRGSEVLQGYLFDKPMPGDEFAALLTGANSDRSPGAGGLPGGGDHIGGVAALQ